VLKPIRLENLTTGCVVQKCRTKQKETLCFVLTLWILLENTNWKMVWNYVAELTVVWRYSRSTKVQNFKTLTDNIMKMRESQEGEEEKSKAKWKKKHEEQCASETFCDCAGTRG
jgi:hypothetical protein